MDEETPLFRHFLGGLLDLGGDLTAFLAPLHQLLQALPGRVLRAHQPRLEPRQPHRRLSRPGSPGSATRIECRVGGADLNPYLAYAALLAAGLHGIEHELDPGPPFSGDAYGGAEIPAVPGSLRDAADRLGASQALRAAMGPEVIEHYVHSLRWELHSFGKAVTDWELIRYFERG